MQGQRVVWRDKGIAAVEAFEAPAPAPGEVLIRTHASLISQGTERAFFLGWPNAAAQFPVYPGYSNVGDVIAVGPGVDLAVGTRVASHAAHASHVVMAADGCVPVPEGASDEAATFFALGAIALQAVRKARVEIGESVLVLGAGLVGLMAAQLARLNGAIPVICADRDEGRLTSALLAGVDATLVTGDDLPERVKGANGGNAPQVVIEATGHPAVIPVAFQSAARFGRVVLLGSTRGETENVNFYRDVHQKGLHVIGAHNSTRPQRDNGPGWWTLNDDHATILRLLAGGRLAAEALVTHRLNWRQSEEAYAMLATGDTTAQGIVLDWSDAA